MPQPKKWTPERVNELREYKKNHTHREIKTKFGSGAIAALTYYNGKEKANLPKKRGPKIKHTFVDIESTPDEPMIQVALFSCRPSEVGNLLRGLK